MVAITLSKKHSKTSKVSNYRYGRGKEYDRLAWARKERKAFLGGRFRGSKISQPWIRVMGFNPDIDLWYVTPKGVYFEQIKSSRYHRPRISKEEIDKLKRFAEFVGMNSPHYWIGYVLLQPYKPTIEIRLN